MNERVRDLEIAARDLEATGDFKVLRRIMPRVPRPATNPSDKTGIVLDLETTGLDHAKDEVIEVGAVKFRFDATGAVSGVADVLQAFNQPAQSIPAEITLLTGITDAMAAGQ